jgi:hypothetical protein
MESRKLFSSCQKAVKNGLHFKKLYIVYQFCTYLFPLENCFYRKLALTRAKHSHKAVSRRKTSDFNQWHSKWLKQHVSDAQHSSITDWFMGKIDGLVHNKTHKVIKSDQDKTPYRTFYKFKAEIIKEWGNCVLCCVKKVK